MLRFCTHLEQSLQLGDILGVLCLLPCVHLSPDGVDLDAVLAEHLDCIAGLARLQVHSSAHLTKGPTAHHLTQPILVEEGAGCVPAQACACSYGPVATRCGLAAVAATVLLGLLV